MQLQRPTRILSPFVSHYWMSRDNADTAHPVLPDGCVDVIFEIGGTTEVRAHGAATRRTACAVSPGYHYLGICFRPGQARHFLTIPAHHLTDSHMVMSALVGLKPDVLADDIAFGQVFQRLEAALSTWLARQPAISDILDQALDIIDRNNGCVRIEMLASELGFSRRQLERRFLDAVGISPKTYAVIRRWQHALALLRSQPALPLVTVALRAGYADQSHMNRDFRRLLGQSPRSAADVAIVQDTSFQPDYTGTVS